MSGGTLARAMRNAVDEPPGETGGERDEQADERRAPALTAHAGHRLVGDDPAEDQHAARPTGRCRR